MFSARQPAEVLRGKMGVSLYFRSNFYLEASPVAHLAYLGSLFWCALGAECFNGWSVNSQTGVPIPLPSLTGTRP